MLVAPTLINIIKYGFLGLVITGAGFLIKNTAVMTHYESNAQEDLTYRARTSKRNESLLLDKNSLKCLTHPNKPFCLMSSSRKIELLRNNHFTSSDSSKNKPHPVYSMLEDFRRVATSLNVTPIILEPSILFCMLPTLQKYQLISGTFHSSLLQTSPDAISIGVFEEDARIMSEEASISKFLKSKFAFSNSRKLLELSEEGNNTRKDFFITNFFFSRQTLTLHVVVFFEKQTFLWLPGLLNDYPVQTEPFGSNSIYDKFAAVPLRFETKEESGFYIPSGIQHFLLQAQQSQFRNCSMATEGDGNKVHSLLTREQLERRSVITIQELKSKLSQYMITFWLWKETLSGWYESCNLFQKTSELNFAVHASTISKQNLTDIFKDNEYVKLIKYYLWEDLLHKIVLNCHDLKINIYLTFEDTNSIWYYEMDSSQQLTKISYLKFGLCSSLVMDQLVHLPCEKTLEKE